MVKRGIIVPEYDEVLEQENKAESAGEKNPLPESPIKTHLEPQIPQK